MDREIVCNCIIEHLIEKNFESRSHSERKTIVKLGRPIPKLNITKQTKAFVRHFQEDWYESTPWLCGCFKLQKNFCWPCLLFSNESNVWSKYGFDDLNNLSKARRRHEVSQSHIVSFVKLRQFEAKCNSEYAVSVNEIFSENFNRTIISNRYVINKLINIICCLSGQTLTLESQLKPESNSRGSYVKLIHLLGALDTELKFHLDESTVLREHSRKVQNDLIHSIGLVVTEEIMKEMKSASHASLMLNVVPNRSHGPQLTTVVRYAMKGTGDIKERFIGLESAQVEREDSAATLRHIDNCYEKFGWSNLDFVAHSYDGNVINVHKHKIVQTKMKEVYKHSVFTHCYAHRFDLVTSLCVSFVKDCHLFFQTLTGFSSFFLKCPKTLSALSELVKGTTEWTNYSSIINSIITHENKIKVLLLTISGCSDQWDIDSALTARGLYHHLTDFQFQFWLFTFHKIFTQSNVLFNKQFKGTLDCNKFITSLQDIRNDFDSIWNTIEGDEEETIGDVSAKRMRLNETKPEKDSCRRTFHNVIDALTKTFGYLDSKALRVMSLLNVNEFQAHSKKFPEPAFSTLTELFGGLFDFSKLKAELLYLYSCPEFAETSLDFIKSTLVRDNLHEDVLKELFSFIMLVSTMPCMRPPVEVGKCSTVERIRRFLTYAHYHPEEELSSLALISVERDFLISLQESKTAEFHERVIRHFAKKNPSIRLMLNNDNCK